MKKILFLSILAIIVCTDRSQAQADPEGWTVRFYNIGVFSSPRIIDLNEDGISDIVLGTGRVEFQKCDSAVIALDGATGEMLWNVSAIDHLYVSPSFQDITGDNIPDVFIGGRSAVLMAIDGKNGEVIWNFDKSQGKNLWFNFYNPQFIADQDGDGYKDILISNGGNVLAEPNETKGRYPGILAVISGKTGKLLASATMPDDKETYMSVSALPVNDGRDYRIIFGSGGETMGGHLYLTTLSQLLKGNISKAKKLDESLDKGYIGPAIWIDINKDGNHDIVANAVEGKLMAFDGRSLKKIWSVKVPNTEAYSSIAPGYFAGDDDTPDFFVNYAVGIWPDLGSCKQVMVNGADGNIEFLDSIGSYQTSTPVVVDLENDGIDEAILNLNVVLLDNLNRQSLHNILAIYDFKNQDILQYWDGFSGSNLSSTPWIGDLDKDGYLDIIYCHGTDTQKTYSYEGIRVTRIATQFLLKSEIKWGSYMGSNYDGIFNE